MDFATAVCAMTGRGVAVRRSAWPQDMRLRFFPAHRVSPPQDMVVLEQGETMSVWRASPEDELAGDWVQCSPDLLSTINVLGSYDTDPMFRQ